MSYKEIQKQHKETDEKMKLLAYLQDMKQHCEKNENILQHLTFKYKNWCELLEKNKDQPVEQQYPKIVQSTNKYLEEMKGNYTYSIKTFYCLLRGNQFQIQQSLQQPTPVITPIISPNIPNVNRTETSVNETQLEDQTSKSFNNKKIEMSQVQQQTCFEDYLKQIQEFEKNFDLKVPDFFKDREIHHFRMLMSNYQITLLKINEVIAVKEMLDATKNERFVAALLLLTKQIIKDIVKRYNSIQQNLQEELLIEKDMEIVKEKNYASFIAQLKAFEQKHRVQFPAFFKSKSDFLRREYYEKRFCLAVSDEDCIKIHQIHQKVRSQRALISALLTTENQFQAIIQRAQNLLYPPEQEQ